VLDQVLLRLAVYIEKLAKIKGKVKGAMMYPAIIVLVAGLVIAAIMIFVIPQFQELFAGSGRELPYLTQIVINISNQFKRFWYLFIIVFGGIPFAIMKYYGTEEGRKNIDIVLIRAPVFGPLVQKSAIARFSRTLGTLLTAGVRILDSLDIAGQTTGNYVVEKALEKAKDSISRGRTLVEPLSKEPFIPAMVSQMIAIGEQTGALDQMLGKMADFYEDEVETAAGTMTSLVEPILMVVLGGIVAVIVIAMYLPIFDLANTVGG
jgi:type IV pilus assembly protein PilC